MLHHKFCPDSDSGWVSTFKDEDFQEAVLKVAGGIDALVVLTNTWIPMIHHIDLEFNLFLMSAKLKRPTSKLTQSPWSKNQAHLEDEVLAQSNWPIWDSV